jgi:hypothetical protein
MPNKPKWEIIVNYVAGKYRFVVMHEDEVVGIINQTEIQVDKMMDTLTKIKNSLEGKKRTGTKRKNKNQKQG